MWMSSKNLVHQHHFLLLYLVVVALVRAECGGEGGHAEGDAYRPLHHHSRR